MFNTQPGSTTALLNELYPDLTEDPTYTCEHCAGKCSEPLGNDLITECCLCANENAPKVAQVKPCRLCAERVQIQKQIDFIAKDVTRQFFCNEHSAVSTEDVGCYRCQVPYCEE